MKRCPNCRARYRDSEICPRCSMELSRLLQIESRLRTLEQIAVRSLLVKDFYLAEIILRRALKLQATPMAKDLLRFTRQQKRRRLKGHLAMPTHDE